MPWATSFVGTFLLDFICEEALFFEQQQFEGWGKRGRKRNGGYCKLA